MAVVLLHGVPETPVIWEPLVALLGRDDVLTPGLPGFGCPTPAGFTATQDAYADWFVGYLESIVADHGPVDLVGHDWGGAISMRAASLRPDLVRSWVCDVIGVFHPDFRWHEFARIWQTAGLGEQYFEVLLNSPAAERIGVLELAGIPRATAARLAAAWDDTMAQCILRLYRSATLAALQEWAGDLGHAATRPGLVVMTPLDPFRSDLQAVGEVADRLGARRTVLEGHGHWWMLTDPAGGAEMLRHFWAESY